MEDRVDDENFIEENSALEINDQNASNKNLNLTCNLHPKVVLQRLSISQMLNSGKKSVNSLSPTSALDTCNSPICSNSILYSPLQLGPSISTPTCSDLDSNSTVNRASKIRRLSSLFQNESELFDCKIRGKSISQVQDDSESD